MNKHEKKNFHYLTQACVSSKSFKSLKLKGFLTKNLKFTEFAYFERKTAEKNNLIYLIWSNLRHLSKKNIASYRGK